MQLPIFEEYDTNHTKWEEWANSEGFTEGFQNMLRSASRLLGYLQQQQIVG